MSSTTKIAFITLPEIRIPTQGIFINLNGFWKPPVCVERFWANGAVIRFTDEADYIFNKLETLTSYRKCIADYYRTFPC